MCPGPGAGLKCCVHPLGGVLCRGHAFAPGSSKLAFGFGLFVSFAQNLFQVPVHPVMCSLAVSLCLSLEERGVQTQALQHCSRGSQAAACAGVTVCGYVIMLCA